MCGASKEEPEAFFHHATSREKKDTFMSRLFMTGAFWSGIRRINPVRAASWDISLLPAAGFIFGKDLIL